MYNPPHFAVEDRAEIYDMVRACRLANLVTSSASGLVATPLPMILNEAEGENGVLYGHIARANPHWKEAPQQDALVIFAGPDAYISPNWYASKARDGKVVPTWNYLAVHAYGPVEFFHEPERLLTVVTRLTNRYESTQPKPWSPADAPPEFIQSQLRAIVGIRIPITRIEAKRKMNQNRTAEDRAGVIRALNASESEIDRAVAKLIPE
jgi:transcriptional regulator